MVTDLHSPGRFMVPPPCGNLLDTTSGKCVRFAAMSGVCAQARAVPLIPRRLTKGDYAWATGSFVLTVGEWYICLPRHLRRWLRGATLQTPH